MFPNRARVLVTTAMLLASAAVGLAACGQAGRQGDAATATGEPKAADYVEAPTVLSAIRAGDGLVTIAGRAAPDAIVRLSVPEGQSWGMTAGPDGQWSFAVPVLATPRMLSLTAEKAGRAVHADGAIVLLPPPAVAAVIARAGSGALAVAPASSRPIIVALDYDSGGGAMVSGVARAGAPVRLLFDNLVYGEGRADALGRFATPAVKQPLTPGPHVIRVETAEGAAQVATRVESPAGYGAGAYRAYRQDDGWRLEWRAGDHAAQATVVFDSAQQLLNEPAK